VVPPFRSSLSQLQQSLAFWFALVLLPTSALSSVEGEGSVRGFVSDSTNGEPLVFATVSLKELARGTSTDIKGYFYIAGVPAGNHLLGVSLVGYRHAAIPVTVREGEITQVSVRLQPGKIELEGLTVVKDRGVRATDREVGLHQISAREISITPINTEADMFRVVQATPGVTTTGDVTARYYVRGGGGDQNLLLVDGVTIYSPFHALGVLSVVDPEVISGIEFHKGGFGPELGGRLSSILNVQTRDGNKMRYSGAAQASLLTGKVSVEGPIPHGSFLIAARKSIFPKTLERFIRSTDAPFDFYDCSFKTTYANPALDENGTLSLHGFLSADRVKNDDPFREDYSVKNVAVGIDWNKVWHSPLRSVVRLSYSGFDAEVLPKESKAVPRSNTVRDISLALDAAYMYSSRDELQFGLEAKSLSTRYVMENLLRAQRAYDLKAWDLVAYVNYHFLRWESFGLDIGIRMHPMQLSTYGPLIFEPRFRASYALLPTLVVHAAAGWYSQEVTTLMNEADVISVFEPWVIIPNYLRSPEAAHFVAGIQYDITEEICLDLEAYFKPMQNLIETNEKKYTAAAYDFISATGTAEGFESSLHYTTDAMLLQAAYTLSWSHLEIGGIRYTPRYDVRHVLNLTASAELGDGWQASAFWSLHSGFPFTPVVGFYDRVKLGSDDPTDLLGGMEAVTAWGERNSQRLPAYHRLDLSCAKRFSWDPVRVSIGLSIVNVYDRKNIFYLDRTTGENIYMLRFAPSFFVKVEL
jgi:hypothetical protein